MLQEIIPFLPPSDSTSEDASRSASKSFMREIQRRGGCASEPLLDQFAEEPRFASQSFAEEVGEAGGKDKLENALARGGHSLFQEFFFFCRVMKVGDLPEAKCIYVETVVDRDSGLAFAKVYPSKSARNAADILATRVVPFFESRGIAIREIYTRKTSEYYGLLPVHPFESLLAASHIQHLEMGPSSRPYNCLCEGFYRFLLKEFFPLALRRSFQISLTQLQKELDTFLEAHNTAPAPVKME